MEEMVQKHLLEPAEIEVDEFDYGNGKPEDWVLPEEGYGGAPEGSHWGGLCNGGRVIGWGRFVCKNVAAMQEGMSPGLKPASYLPRSARAEARAYPRSKNKYGDSDLRSE